ncbi:MAG TPA: HlyD family secretion protein [Caulobacteraceae bacterium]|nr:HlyD family secretion protein [Caulobacteraceae bacterium]
MASGGSGGAAATVRWRALAVGVVAIVAIAAGLVWIFAPKATTSTDDAYVQGDKTIVSPKVRGMVTAIDAKENRRVAAGDLLVTIDPEEYDLKIAQAKGDLLAAQAAQRAARAGLSTLAAEEKVAEGTVNSAQQLAGTNAVANPVFRQAFETAHGQALVAARTRGQIQASLSEAVAAEYRAKTELEAAQLQKAQTAVKAPAPGIVANIEANVGSMVQPGVTLMTIIGEAQPVVTANFKETQIGRMRAGQSATVHIDALPGRNFTGHVDSIAPGSGSQFALLPFEPGAGNFTKIVQRVPVRIVLDPGQPGLDRLRAGLSAEVTVRLERPAPP